MAQATLYGDFGSQTPGMGSVQATVGSSVGAKSYAFLAPDPRSGQVFVRVAYGVLAGDATDSTSINYTARASTTVTIAGLPNATYQVRLGFPEAGQVVPQGLVTINGGTGSATVTLDSQGNATFTIASTGQLPPGVGIRLPFTVSQVIGGVVQSPLPGAKPTFEIGLLPGQFLIKALDYVAKLGWGIVTGDTEGLDGMFADMGFSMLPIVGVYSDVRDLVKELFKLWPGGEDPNWLVVGFSMAGILAEITPFDNALDIAKLVFKKIKPNGVMAKAIFQRMKAIGSTLGSKAIDAQDVIRKEIGDFFEFLRGSLGPPFGPAYALPGGGSLLEWYERKVVTKAEDFTRLNSLAARFPDFNDKMAGFIGKYGDETSGQIGKLLTGLNDDLQDILAKRGKLEVVAGGIAKGNWNQKQLESYARAVEVLKADAPLIKKFDAFADVPGAGDFTRNLMNDATTNGNGVLSALKVAEQQGKDSIRAFNVPLPSGKRGDIDVVTDTKAITVKGGENGSETFNSLFNQLDYTIKYAKEKGLIPILAMKGTLDQKTLKNAFEKAEIKNNVKIIIQQVPQ